MSDPVTGLPVDLAEQKVTTVVSQGSWARVKGLADAHGYKLRDVVSIALAHFDEAELHRLMHLQIKGEEAMPKLVRQVLKDGTMLSDADRKMVIDALSGPPTK